MAKKHILNRWYELPLNDPQVGGDLTRRNFTFHRRMAFGDENLHFIRRYSYELKINAAAIRGSDNYGQAIEEIFEECLQYAIELHGTGAKKVRFVMTSPLMYQEMNLGYISVEQLNAERFMHHLKEFAQSRRDVIIGDDLIFTFEFSTV